MTYAASFCAASEAVDRRAQDDRNLSTALQNRSELLTSLGRLREAEVVALEAVTLARSVKDIDVVIAALGRTGNILALLGRVREAIATFERSDAFKQSIIC